MITIVIPAYNAAELLPGTLNSIVAQSYVDWEAIVVDDGSIDGTCLVAQAYADRDPRIRLLRQSNAGPSAARNNGAKAGRNDATELIFLDADDLWEIDTLEVLKRRLDENPDLVAAYGLAAAADFSGGLVDIGSYEAHQRRRFAVAGNSVVPLTPDQPTTFACEIVTEMIVTCGTVLIRRSTYFKSDGWSEEVRLWEDWDLWLRLTRIGGFAFVDHPVLRKRSHESNLSSDWQKVEAGERAVRKRLLESLSSNPELLQAARLGAKFHHDRIIADKWEWVRSAASSGDVISAIKQLRHIARLKVLGPVR